MRIAQDSLWRNRDFNLLWGSYMFSELGSNISKLAFPLLVLALTGSPVQAGIVGTAASVARLVARMPAGVLVDRVDRRKAMLASDAIRLVAFTALAALVMTDNAVLAVIVVVAVLEAICGAVFEIAERSALPMIIPVTQMPDAVARNSVRGSVTGLVGPPLGGLLYSVSRSLPFVAHAVSYLVSLIGVALIRTPMQKEKSSTTANSPINGMGDAIRFVLGHSFLRPLLIIASSFNLALGGTMFALILILRVHGVSAPVIGLAEAILGIGGLLGALAAGFIRRRLPIIVLILGICWSGVVLLAADALLAGHILSVAPIAAVVFLLPAINSVLLGYQAAITPNEVQGRVVSVLMTFAGGLATLGPILAGIFVERFGGGFTMLFFAAVMAVAALAATMSDGIRSMRPLEEIAAERAAQSAATSTSSASTPTTQ